MGIHNKCLIIYSKVWFSCNFDLNLSKLLSNGGSTIVQIIINILNVKHNIFSHPVSFQNSLEFMLPVISLINFKSLHGFNINNMNKLRNLIHQNQWSDSTKDLWECPWKNGKIISTYWSKFDHEGVLVMVCSVLFIMTNQLLSILSSTGNLVLDEIYESLGVWSMFELKVDTLTVRFFSNVGALFLCIVFQNQLF